jgi:hypothetical protein
MNRTRAALLALALLALAGAAGYACTIIALGTPDQLRVLSNVLVYGGLTAIVLLLIVGPIAPPGWPKGRGGDEPPPDEPPPDDVDRELWQMIDMVAAKSARICGKYGQDAAGSFGSRSASWAKPSRRAGGRTPSPPRCSAAGG